MNKTLVLILVTITIFIGLFIFTSKLKVKDALEIQTNTDEISIQSNNTQQKNSDSVINSGEYEVKAETINYYGDKEGFYVEPLDEANTNKEFPGVVMIHEWWGLNQNIKDMATQLAKHGYRVLAVDLFGTVATTSEEARKQVGELDQEDALKNMRAAKEYLENKGAVKIASLGWCFGGGQSLQTSLNQNIDATVIYYGNLVTSKEELANLSGPVLGIFGNKDTSIPTEKVYEFKSSMDEIQIKNNINIYDGVGHAFANPSGPNYAPTETNDAWNKTLNFLEENLK